MLGDPPAAIPVARGRVGQLGRDAHQVAGDGSVDGSRRFDGDVHSASGEGLRQVANSLGDHRLASGDHDVRGLVLCHFAGDLRDRHRSAIRLPRRVGSVAPGAAQVASGGAYEDAGHSDEPSFALKRVKDLADFHSRFCPRKGITTSGNLTGRLRQLRETPSNEASRNRNAHRGGQGHPDHNKNG